MSFSLGSETNNWNAQTVDRRLGCIVNDEQGGSVYQRPAMLPRRGKTSDKGEIDRRTWLARRPEWVGDKIAHGKGRAESMNDQSDRNAWRVSEGATTQGR